MYIDDIPLYSVLNEVEESVARLLLDESDVAELLGAREYGLKDIRDLVGTEYEDIIDAFVSAKEGELMHMQGVVFKFRLTDAFKKHFIARGLHGMLYSDDTPLLENLTLYSGDTLLFTCQSHEVFDLYGMFEICDGLAEKTLAAARGAIERSALYAPMKEVYNRICARPKRRIKKETDILLDLHCYVDRAKRQWFYQAPMYECTFERYKKIAEDYLSAEAYAVLSAAQSFEDLQPCEVPHTAEDVMSGNYGGTQFLLTDSYSRIRKELCILEYIIDMQNSE
ncbi:MAG: hypothetical protein NC184_00460 [Roseburia sp.]|nr:hypothetical protein [Roseburia sp.]